MARLVNLSPSRFSHLFKAETRLSPAEYLKSLKMQKAKELLETTFLTNQQVITRVGINDESHFWRDFKRIYGLTPAEYRTRYLVGLSLITDPPKAKSAPPAYK